MKLTRAFQDDSKDYELHFGCYRRWKDNEYFFRWGLKQKGSSPLDWAVPTESDVFVLEISSDSAGRPLAEPKEFKSLELDVAGFCPETEAKVEGSKYLDIPAGSQIGQFLTYRFYVLVHLDKQSFQNPGDLTPLFSAIAELRDQFPTQAQQLGRAASRLSRTPGEDLILNEEIDVEDGEKSDKFYVKLKEVFEGHNIATLGVAKSVWLALLVPYLPGTLSEEIKIWLERDTDGWVRKAWGQIAQKVFNNLSLPDLQTIRAVRRNRKVEKFSLVLNEVAMKTGFAKFSEMFAEEAKYSWPDFEMYVGPLFQEEGSKFSTERADVVRFLKKVYSLSYESGVVTSRQREWLATKLAHITRLFLGSSFWGHLFQGLSANDRKIQLHMWLSLVSRVCQQFEEHHEVRRRMVLAGSAFQSLRVQPQAIAGQSVKEERAQLGVLAGLQSDPVEFIPGQKYSAVLKWRRDGQVLGERKIDDCVKWFEAQCKPDELKARIEATGAYTVEKAFWQIIESVDTAYLEATEGESGISETRWVYLGSLQQFTEGELRTHNEALKKAQGSQIQFEIRQLWSDVSSPVVLAKLLVPIAESADINQYVREQLRDTKWDPLHVALLTARTRNSSRILVLTSGEGRVGIRVHGVGGKPPEHISQGSPSSLDDKTAFTSCTIVASPSDEEKLVDGLFLEGDLPHHSIIPQDLGVLRQRPEFVGWPNDDTLIPNDILEIASIDSLQVFWGAPWLDEATQQSKEVLTTAKCDLPEQVLTAWGGEDKLRTLEYEDYEKPKDPTGQRNIDEGKAPSQQPHQKMGAHRVHPGFVSEKEPRFWMFPCFLSGEWGRFKYPVKRDPTSPFKIPRLGKATPDKVPFLWASQAEPPPMLRHDDEWVETPKSSGLYSLNIKLNGLQTYAMKWIARNAQKVTFDLIVLRKTPKVDLRLPQDQSFSSIGFFSILLDPYLSSPWLASLLGSGWMVTDIREWDVESRTDADQLLSTGVRVCGGWEYKVALIAKRDPEVCYQLATPGTRLPVQHCKLTNNGKAEEAQIRWLYNVRLPLDYSFDRSSPQVSVEKYLVARRAPAHPGHPRFSVMAANAGPRATCHTLAPLKKILGKDSDLVPLQLAEPPISSKSALDSFKQVVMAYFLNTPERVREVIKSPVPIGKIRTTFQEEFLKARLVERVPDTSLARVRALGALEVRGVVSLGYENNPIVDRLVQNPQDVIPIVATRISRASVIQSLVAISKVTLVKGIQEGEFGCRFENSKAAENGDSFVVLLDSELRAMSTFHISSDGFIQAKVNSLFPELKSGEFLARVHPVIRIDDWKDIADRPGYKRGILVTPITNEEFGRGVKVSLGVGIMVAPCQSLSGDPPAREWEVGLLSSEDLVSGAQGLLVRSVTIKPSRDLGKGVFCYSILRESEVRTLSNDIAQPTKENENPSLPIDVLERGFSDVVCYFFRHIGPGTLVPASKDGLGKGGIAPRESEPHLVRVEVPSSITPPVPKINSARGVSWGVEVDVRTRTSTGPFYESETVILEYDLKGRRVGESLSKSISSVDHLPSAIDAVNKGSWSALSPEQIAAIARWFRGAESVVTQSYPSFNVREQWGDKSKAHGRLFVERVETTGDYGNNKDVQILPTDNLPVREYTEWSLRLRAVDNADDLIMRLESDWTEFSSWIRPTAPSIRMVEEANHDDQLGTHESIEMHEFVIELFLPHRNDTEIGTELDFDLIVRPESLLPYKIRSNDGKPQWRVATEFASSLDVTRLARRFGSKSLLFSAKTPVQPERVMKQFFESKGEPLRRRRYQIALRAKANIAGAWKQMANGTNFVVDLSYPVQGMKVSKSIRFEEYLSVKAPFPSQLDVYKDEEYLKGWKQAGSGIPIFERAAKSFHEEEVREILSKLVVGDAMMVGATQVYRLRDATSYSMVALREKPGEKGVVELGFIR